MMYYVGKRHKNFIHYIQRGQLSLKVYIKRLSGTNNLGVKVRHVCRLCRKLKKKMRVK
jgi:hypothetical protein